MDDVRYLQIANERKYGGKNLPLIILLVILVIPLILLLFGSFHQIKKLNARVNGQLVGVAFIQKDEFPKWSKDAIFPGAWQQQFTVWLNSKIPFRSFLIKLHNQIYYSIFYKSYMDGGDILRGQKNYLYSQSFLIAYCNSSHQLYLPQQFTQWVQRLTELNNFFEKRGQKFIYVMTPTKAAYYPQYIPKGYHCPQQEADQNYIMAKRALKKVSFSYVDGIHITMKNQSKYGVLLFPRGGIHWTDLGAALTAREISKKISILTSRPLPELKFTYSPNFNPTPIDLDFTSLLNLLSPAKHFPASEISFVELPSSKRHRPLKIAFVGGSFLIQIIDGLAAAKYFGRMDYYFYLNIRHYYFPDGTLDKRFPLGTPESPNHQIPEDYQKILDADVVVLEENQTLIRSPHLKMLKEMLIKKSS